MKELISIIGNEWLEESELSFDVILLDSPSISIHCQIHETSFGALYNSIVGVNLMSTSFAHALFENLPLTPTTKFLKSPSGHILPSFGIIYVLPIKVKGTMEPPFDRTTNQKTYPRRTNGEFESESWEKL